MTGYLQRLLDPALPASEPPALAPVVKSTSPIFEQNQLLGLASFDAGEADPEVTPHGAEGPSARTSLRPAAAPAVRTLEITRQHLQLATPAPPICAEIGPAMAGDPPAARLAAANAIGPLPHEAPDTGLEPIQPDRKLFEPAPRLATALVVEPEGTADLTATPGHREAVFAQAEIDGMATEAAPAAGRRPASQPNTENRPPASQVVAREVPRTVEAIERLPNAPPPPGVLEPRPRPDFDDDLDLHQAQSMPPPAPPRITIGRVTVELVPDHAPVARPASAPRTAEAASMIGPLGNRRARRRLFALTRL